MGFQWGGWWFVNNVIPFETQDGRVLRRNRSHLRKTTEDEDEVDETPPTEIHTDEDRESNQTEERQSKQAVECQREQKVEIRTRSGRPNSKLKDTHKPVEMSFQDVRTALVLSYGDGQIDDEEFVLLYDAYKSTNPAYPYWEFGDFCWEEYDSSEFEAMFRVKQEDIPILVDALRVPETFKCGQGFVMALKGCAYC
ncbi:Hypothetical predicted protein [Paramuricea clavata]|uniref:Uncharacterized protein n=1 Tax=Paramuricea clavata TaxID=317549 RepID=A0A7D9JJ38_PARCT|nr:Hypothetical predicted protein [Paramuricea clavata]